MNGFRLFVAICLANACSALLDLNKICESLELSQGDVNYEFIHLGSLRNHRRDGEVFRYLFYYNYTKEDYLLKLFLTKATNVKEFGAQNNYWLLHLSDTSDTNVGYSTLSDQDNSLIDKSENKLKLYGNRLVAFEIVLTDEKELKVVQPGKKESYLKSKDIEFPLYSFAGLQLSGGSLLFYYDCEESQEF